MVFRHPCLPNSLRTNQPFASDFTPLSASETHFQPRRFSSHPPRFRPSPVARILQLFCASVSLVACSSTPDRDSITEAFPIDQPRPEAAGTVESASAWSILIVAYQGPSQEANAAQALVNVRTHGGLREAYVERRGEATVVAYGRYPGPDDRQAQADLKRIRSVTIDGGRPFAGAVLVPPPTLYLVGQHPEYDLRTARRDLGDQAMYTLQIGVYKRMDGRQPTPSDIAEFRKAAEQAVIDLRREGVPAFYIHMPESSTVTVGVFGPNDYVLPTDPAREQPYRSPELIKWRERFPHNLVNGATVYSRVPGVPASDPRSRRVQESSLVLIPSN